MFGDFSERLLSANFSIAEMNDLLSPVELNAKVSASHSNFLEIIFPRGFVINPYAPRSNPNNGNAAMLVMLSNAKYLTRKS